MVGLSHSPRTPSHERCSSRSMTPWRSPIPSPFESANDRTYTWYSTPPCHQPAGSGSSGDLWAMTEPPGRIPTLDSRACPQGRPAHHRPAREAAAGPADVPHDREPPPVPEPRARHADRDRPRLRGRGVRADRPDVVLPAVEPG